MNNENVWRKFKINLKLQGIFQVEHTIDLKKFNNKWQTKWQLKQRNKQKMWDIKKLSIASNKSIKLGAADIWGGILKEE